MKLSIAQFRPASGDIELNITNHIRLINLAIDQNADVIIFPELSISGYEPQIASELATDQDDARFNIFQKISDSEHITIGIGAPTKQPDGVAISMILFQPNQQRTTFSKQFLHHSETPYFVAGSGYNDFSIDSSKIAVAICYELSVPEHSARASENGADIYMASVVESVNGVEQSIAQLSETARKYGMTTFMANCIGQTGAYNCPGKSSIWNNTGELIGQLNDEQEGILVLDNETREVTNLYLRASAIDVTVNAE